MLVLLAPEVSLFMSIGGTSRPSGDCSVPSFGKIKTQQKGGCSDQGALSTGQGIEGCHACVGLTCGVPASHATACVAWQALIVQGALAGAHGRNELVSPQPEALLGPVS